MPQRFEQAQQQGQLPVELWSMDEHRVGLKPILRKVWAKRGKRPVAVIRPRYKWLYIASFVHPESGRSSWWMVPHLDKEIFAGLLGAFAAEYAQAARLLVVLDGAGWHKGVSLPGNVELIFLPPYSPELQPAEHLWVLADEVLVNRWFTTLDALQELLAPHLVRLSHRTQQIRALTLFHWWPTAPRPSPN